MAMSLKCGAVTLAAIVLLLCGVEVAQAGGIEGVVDDVTAVAENDQTTQAVDDVTEALDEALGPVDTGAVVSAAKGAVDEAVADPQGTIESAVEQVSSTVDGLVGDAGTIVDPFPIGKAAGGVSDVVNPVVSVEQKSEAPSFAAAEPAPSSQQSAESAQGLVSRAAKGSQTRAAAPSAQLPLRAHAPTIDVGSIVTVPDTGAQRPSLSTRSLSPPFVIWSETFSAPEPAMSHGASSAAPAAPAAPPPPGDQPATAASVAGAAGAALLAALFSAFLFVAPRKGRVARPGAILVRPQPCLSLAERPG